MSWQWRRMISSPPSSEIDGPGWFDWLAQLDPETEFAAGLNIAKAAGATDCVIAYAISAAEATT